MQERCKKCLCYFYDEKWRQGYRCLKPKLFLLEEMEFIANMGNEVGIDSGSEVTAMDIKDEVEIASISLHTILGASRPRTMRLVDQLGKKRVVILIDTGSTHNFVDIAWYLDASWCYNGNNLFKLK